MTFRQLLAATLGNDIARPVLVDDVLALEVELYGMSNQDCSAAKARLLNLDSTSLADALISGRLPRNGERILRWPAPNTLFSRDLAAIVGNNVVLSFAAEPARRRDMTLFRAIVHYHPFFDGAAIVDISEDGDVRGATLEGGDVQVIAPGVALIGVGVRTTLEAVRRLSKRLLADGFRAVLACEMPRQRAAMHLDTLFTIIDRDRCLVYPPLVTRPGDIGIKIHQFDSDGARVVGEDLLAALAEVGAELEPVFCGGHNEIDQTREQWSDGANAFALAPGVIVCYGRNEQTLRELNKVGFEIVEPAWFTQNALLCLAQPHRKVAVALTGHELVRGRGGPRCLTLPLRRSTPII